MEKSVELFKNLPLLLFAIINLIAFGAFGIDKLKAIRGSYRISEKTLFILTLLGGGFGSLLGMFVWRHKIRKWYFAIGVPVILIVEVVLYTYLFVWQ